MFYNCEKHQGWTYFQAVYFTFISLTSIGDGDDTLVSMRGKLSSLCGLLVVPTVTMVISTGIEAAHAYLTEIGQWFKEQKNRIFHKQTPEVPTQLSSKYPVSRIISFLTQ